MIKWTFLANNKSPEDQSGVMTLGDRKIELTSFHDAHHIGRLLEIAYENGRYDYALMSIGEFIEKVNEKNENK